MLLHSVVNHKLDSGSKNRIDVIYDISLLGTAYYFQRIRTGIARAIESLLFGLTDIPECSIHFSAYNSPEQLIQALEYLVAHPALRGNTFCGPDSVIVDFLVRAARNAYPLPAEATNCKYRRRAVSLMINRFSAKAAILNTELTSRADIIHSTYYPLPQDVGGSKRMQRFITIYDMIPVLLPEYFEPQTIKNFMNIIRSIRPDDWVIAISQSTKNDFCEQMRFDPARVFVTPLAASELFYRCDDSKKNAEVRRKYRIPDGPYALSLCTLEPRKNIDHTIRCFVRTVREQRIPDLSLVLVGTKGWDFDRIFAEIMSDPETQERIIVTGYVPDEDLASLYSAAMVFVYPTLYEGFGLPPLEAMQCGVPVITSNTSSLPEVVGNAGFMVAPTDEDALCQAFWDIYRNSALRANMAGHSLARARHFSWEQCSRDTYKAYLAAIGS